MGRKNFSIYRGNRIDSPTDSEFQSNGHKFARDGQVCRVVCVEVDHGNGKRAFNHIFIRASDGDANQKWKRIDQLFDQDRLHQSHQQANRLH